MKKLIALLLALVLCCAAALTAFAEPAFENTQLFVNYLSENGIGYTFITDNNGKERVNCDVGTADGSTLHITLIFIPENERVSYFLWNLFDLQGIDREQAYRIVNSMNADYNTVKLTLHEDDNFIDLNYDLLLQAGAPNTLDMIIAALKRFSQITLEVYTDLTNRAAQ